MLDRLAAKLRCIPLSDHAAHMRRMVVCESPVSLAMERIDQCVASCGLSCKVRSITAAT